MLRFEGRSGAGRVGLLATRARSGLRVAGMLLLWRMSRDGDGEYSSVREVWRLW